MLNNYIKANTDRNYELLMNLKAFFPDLKKYMNGLQKLKVLQITLTLMLKK